MKTRFLENLRKRIIFAIIGIVGYYLSPLPMGILINIFFHGEILTSIWAFYVFKGTAISFLVGFLYIACVKVKPSLIPHQKKYRQMIIVSIVIIASLSVLIPSGLIVNDWKQGQCLITSSPINEKERFAGTVSSSINSESECVRHCEFSGRLNMNEDKFCEFNGLFGSSHWIKTPEDFENIENKISWNGN
jgi:hypothetical protein